MTAKYRIVHFVDLSPTPDVAVESSEPKVLDWLFSEMAERTSLVTKFQRSSSHLLVVTGQRNESEFGGRWLRQLLCESGWKPLDWDTYRLAVEGDA